MGETKGLHIIKALRSKWSLVTALSDLLLSAGFAFLLSVITRLFFGWNCCWGILYGLVLLTLLFFIHHRWAVNNNDIAELLDQTYPQLEESSGLLLREAGSLNLLEELQYKKTSNALQQLNRPLAITKKIIVPAFSMVLMLVTGIILQHFSFSSAYNMPAKKQLIIRNPGEKETLLPQLAGIQVSVQPPAYTAKAVRKQQSFNILAEEGANVDWQLQTNTAAAAVKFIFNDKQTVILQPIDAGHTQWRFRRKADTTGFYQLNIDGRLSELYKIETIPDKSPLVQLVSPKQYTTIEYGETPQVKVVTSISDDYGISAASIAATIASGSGEAVKFREQKIAMPGFIAGNKQYHLQQVLSLTAMGMQPGDELYFYVQATDNHQQQTRSDIYIVHLPDTAQLMSLEGLANTLTLKPEYFRSQRQIIIETEQLLKDKDTISIQAFKDRSNNLGIDQKLLRLRYGKFLGDEAESGESGADAVGDLSDFSNADKVRDAFTDKHDNAEDATFYEPETKKQLRATLTEMWGAELHLRTFTPKEALPFEYKALRLLKDLQQQSRVYVAKANFKTTPLDLKKRLTGDLSKVQETRLQKDIQQGQDLLEPVRTALAVLEQLRANGNSRTLSAQDLEQANLRLHEKAIQQPGLYINAIAAMKRITTAVEAGSPLLASDITTAQQGLQLLLNAAKRLPSAEKSSSKKALSKQYFDNLQNRQP